jgi:hypothetical protein
MDDDSSSDVSGEVNNDVNSNTSSDAGSVPVPYEIGSELRIHRHVPPKPFGGPYRHMPRELDPVWDDDGMPVPRLPFALDHPPLETQPLDDDDRSFTITGVKTVRHLGSGASSQRGGPHVFTGYLDGDESAAYVAKVYDGLDYPFENEDSGWDFMTLADRDYAIEAWAYESMQPVETVGGRVVPEYFGAWTFALDTDEQNRQRWVRMILLQLIPGETALHIIVRAQQDGVTQHHLLPDEEFRLRVLKSTFEAEVAICWNADVMHEDLEPRNVMAQEDGSVVIIDLNQAEVRRFRRDCSELEFSEDSRRLTPSPLERHWPFAPGCGTFANIWGGGTAWADWIPQSWHKNKELAAEWVLKTWASPPPDKYRPLSDYFLNHRAHKRRSPRLLEALEKLGRKPAE